MSKSTFERLLEDYYYELPPRAIAERPASPRDAAKLLVYDRANGKSSFDAFARIGKYLPPGSVLVVNETKVVPARLKVKKATGGAVELFYLKRKGGELVCLTNQALPPGSVLSLGKLSFTVMGREGSAHRVRPSFQASKIFSVLDKYGQTPLPPYLKRSPLNEGARREKYQAVFARERGSVAAPTASLHFTGRLISSLKRRGISVERVTLHVGLGTFAPLTPESVEAGRLHEEEYEISPAAARRLNAAKEAGRKIIAVGTTSCRALESAAREGRLANLYGATDIFIRPPYEFAFVDGLVTNFHVPRSSLLMLVAAFLTDARLPAGRQVGREKLFELYSLALKKKMKFLSFGDGMLIV